MLTKFIRDFKISRNHKRRVNSIVIRPNEDIVRKMDEMKSKYLEAERKEQQSDTAKYKTVYEMFKWLISNDGE